MTNPQRIVMFTIISLVLCGLAIAFQRPPAEKQPPNERIIAAASAFVSGLEDAGREKSRFEFNDSERFDWHFVPRERKGLPFSDMSPAQRKAAHRLMQSTLSGTGYLKATGVMHLEAILGRLTNRPDRRDPEGYFVSIFGKPAAESPWGWRLEGHHLSMNFTVVGDLLQPTPTFIGSNPAIVPSGPFAGWQLLGREENLARRLLGMLNENQRERAVIAASAPQDIITGADRKARLERFEGLPASEMTPEQRTVLMQLVAEYVDNVATEIAEAQMDRIRRAGIEKLHFAWAGGTGPGDGHYYRVHGPTVLFEYDNTQNGANHVHSVWRDLENDFGDELLRHYRRESRP